MIIWFICGGDCLFKKHKSFLFSLKSLFLVSISSLCSLGNAPAQKTAGARSLDDPAQAPQILVSQVHCQKKIEQVQARSNLDQQVFSHIYTRYNIISHQAMREYPQIYEEDHTLHVNQGCLAIQHHPLPILAIDHYLNPTQLASPSYNHSRRVTCLRYNHSIRLMRKVSSGVLEND